MEHGAGYLVGLLIGLAIGLLVGGAVGAVILRLATRWVEGFTPRFWLAFGTAVSAYVIAMVVNFAAGIFIGLGARAAGVQAEIIRWIAMAIGAVIGFLVSATMIRALIRRPDGSLLGFGRACLIALVQALLGLVVLAIVFACVYAIRRMLGLVASPYVSM